MTKWGMRPGVAHNPDPTFAQAEARIMAKARSRAKFAASLVFRILEMMGYRVCGEIALQDNQGNVFHIENGGK